MKNKHVVSFVAWVVKHNRMVLAIAFVLAFLRTADAFKEFIRHVDTFNTPEEWRFYFSLISFLIFFSTSVFVVATIVGMEIYRKRKK